MDMSNSVAISALVGIFIADFLYKSEARMESLALAN
jgi:hypothetical protein